MDNETDWEVLYHYTSLPGFFRILSSGVIALCDITKSNDPAEGVYSLQMMKKAYSELERREEIDDNTYRRFHKSFFLFSEMESTFGRLQQTALSLSVCEPELPLALWRAYGDNGCGIALGISKQKMQEIGKREGFGFKAVQYYSEKEMLEKYCEFWKNHINDNEEALKDALSEQYFNGYFIKRKENAFEREWRLIYSGLRLDDYCILSPQVPENMNAYVRRDDLVIYYELSLKEEHILDTVVL